MRIVSKRTLALVLLCSLAAVVGAQSDLPGPPPRPDDEIGVHVVKPGETLWDITELYLGTSVVWRENWRLNPQVENPRRLRVGTRLRVITFRPLVDRTALIEDLEREVDQRPAAEQDWIEAHQGDELSDNDAVRTAARSSAQLGFDDGTDLVMGELSTVILRQINERLTGVKQETIEIQRGQADLTATRRGRTASDIEVVVASARSRPRVGADGRAQSRLRRSDDGAAVMVYAGSSSVESGGATVDVPRGMGTAVAEGQPPAPPERLLTAPRPLEPRDVTIAFANPILRWSAVTDATSYTVEVCDDADCAKLIDTASGIGDLLWQPSRPLPGGRHLWRVRAVSRSGLDGYPSSPVPFEIAGGQGLEAPVVAVFPQAPGTVTDGGLELGPVGGVVLRANDDVSGVSRVELRWDGGAWIEWSGDALALPSAGSHTLEVRAHDRAGRSAAYGPYTVSRSADRPDPPRATAEPPPQP